MIGRGRGSRSGSGRGQTNAQSFEAGACGWRWLLLQGLAPRSCRRRRPADAERYAGDGFVGGIESISKRSAWCGFRSGGGYVGSKAAGHPGSVRCAHYMRRDRIAGQIARGGALCARDGQGGDQRVAPADDSAEYRMRTAAPECPQVHGRGARCARSCDVSVETATVGYR